MNAKIRKDQFNLALRVNIEPINLGTDQPEASDV